MAEGSDDQIWQVKSGATPPIGTKVTVIIEKKK
jgi:hypothetical protein